MHKGWQSILNCPDARTTEGIPDPDPEQLPNLEESDDEHGLHGLLNQLKESQKAHAPFAADAQTKEQVKPKLKPVEPSSASDSEIEVFGGDLFKESKFKGLKANQHEEVDLEDALEKQMDYVV